MKLLLSASRRIYTGASTAWTQKTRTEKFKSTDLRFKNRQQEATMYNTVLKVSVAWKSSSSTYINFYVQLIITSNDKGSSPSFVVHWIAVEWINSKSDRLVDTIISIISCSKDVNQRNVSARWKKFFFPIVPSSWHTWLISYHFSPSFKFTMPSFRSYIVKLKP